MGFLDWIPEEKYKSERELLKALLDHTEQWYNEITVPLQEFLFEMLTGRQEMRPGKYVELARELHLRKIEANHGDYLNSTIEQMSKVGIPLFASRHELRSLTAQFLESGRFLKDIVICFADWDDMNEASRNESKKLVQEEWERFRASKEELTAEISRHIRKAERIVF